MVGANEALRFVEADLLNWFLLRVPPGKELTAVRILENCNMLAMCPTHRATRKVSRHVSRVVDAGERPSLSGYVFIAFAPSIPVDDIPWFEVRKLHLIQSIVGNGERKPMRVPYDGAKGLWRLFAPPTLFAAKVAKQARIYRTDRVKLNAGPFKGYQGMVEDIGDGDAKILIEMFGRKVQVALRAEQLEKAA